MSSISTILLAKMGKFKALPLADSYCALEYLIAQVLCDLYSVNDLVNGRTDPYILDGEVNLICQKYDYIQPKVLYAILKDKINARADLLKSHIDAVSPAYNGVDDYLRHRTEVARCVIDNVDETLVDLAAEIVSDYRASNMVNAEDTETEEVSTEGFISDVKNKLISISKVMYGEPELVKEIKEAISDMTFSGRAKKISGKDSEAGTLRALSEAGRLVKGQVAATKIASKFGTGSSMDLAEQYGKTGVMNAVKEKGVKYEVSDMITVKGMPYDRNAKPGHTGGCQAFSVGLKLSVMDNPSDGRYHQKLKSELLKVCTELDRFIKTREGLADRVNKLATSKDGTAFNIALADFILGGQVVRITTEQLRRIATELKKLSN